MVFYPDIPSGYFLMCIQSGVTGSSSLDFSSIKEYQTLKDGVVTWIVTDFSKIKDLSNLVYNMRIILDKIGTTIPDIDFSKANRELLEEYTNDSTSWHDDVSIEIPYSGYCLMNGTGIYSGYTGDRAMYMHIGSSDIMRTSGVAEHGRDTSCGPVWLYAGIKNVSIGYIGFSKVRVYCWHIPEEF